MDYSTMKTRVTSYLDRDDTDIDTLVGRWINDTRTMIATLYNFDYLYSSSTLSVTGSSTPGGATSDLPTDYLDHLVIMNSNQKIELLKPDQIYEYITSEAEASPGFYVLEGTSIRILPTPESDLSLTLRYYARPSSFSSDSDEDYMSRTYFMAIIFYASALGMLHFEDPRAEQFFSLFNIEKENMLRREIMKKHNRMSLDEELNWLTSAPRAGGGE